MEVIFDPDKAAANLRKHGVRLTDAVYVLSDPLALTKEDIDAEGEARFVSLGVDSSGRLLVVVFTYRDDCIRLISARTATRKERMVYERRI